MGNHEEDNTDLTTSTFNPEVTDLWFSSSSDFYSQTDETSVENFENVGLKSNDDDTGGSGGGSNYDLKDDVVPESSKALPLPLPLRPYAGDCPHYIRTGMCKFGFTCKFNHPLKRHTRVVKDKDWCLDKAAQTECKYYLTAGGCKFGDACRYSHSKKESEIDETPDLNFLGLPKRLGEKECPYYMRNGSCGYGAQCMFHHPEPFSVGGLDLQKLCLDDKSLRQSGYSLGSPTTESASLRLLYQRDQAPWFSHPSSGSTFSCLNDCSFYMTANSVPQGMQWHSEFPWYRADEFPQQRREHPHLNPEANRADMLEQDIPMEVEEFPERPGQAECANFVKTGNWFHHPKGQPTCVLSDKGLPLRPEGKICPHYGSVGLCVYGRACPFDHPVNYKSSML